MQYDKSPITMQQGAFVLKMETRNWRMCVVKQVPELPTSSWMMFGESMKDKNKTTFQLEFKPHQETMMIQHVVNMAEAKTEANRKVQLRMVLVTDAPAVSCIGSLWSLNGLEMYRLELDTENSLVNSLHQSIYMLNLSPQVAEQPQKQSQSQQSQSRHSMQTRSSHRP
jgi:hypothetical protein